MKKGFSKETSLFSILRHYKDIGAFSGKKLLKPAFFFSGAKKREERGYVNPLRNSTAHGCKGVPLQHTPEVGARIQ